MLICDRQPALDRIANEARTWGMDQLEIIRRKNDPVLQEYHEIMDRLRKREDVHPQELYDIAVALQEDGYYYELAMLNKVAG